MRTRLRVLGGTHSDLLALRDWLVAAPDFHDRVTFDLPGTRPGEKGGMATVLLVVQGPGGAPALTDAVSAWLDRRECDVAVEITAPDGGVTEITASRPRLE